MWREECLDSFVARGILWKVVAAGRVFWKVVVAGRVFWKVRGRKGVDELMLVQLAWGGTAGVDVVLGLRLCSTSVPRLSAHFWWPWQSCG